MSCRHFKIISSCTFMSYTLGFLQVPHLSVFISLKSVTAVVVVMFAQHGDASHRGPPQSACIPPICGCNHLIHRLWSHKAVSRDLCHKDSSRWGMTDDWNRQNSLTNLFVARLHQPPPCLVWARSSLLRSTLPDLACRAASACLMLRTKSSSRLLNMRFLPCLLYATWLQSSYSLSLKRPLRLAPLLPTTSNSESSEHLQAQWLHLWMHLCLLFYCDSIAGKKKLDSTNT